MGGSIKLGFMMVKLAREHGWRYVAQTSGAGVKKIGGLEKLDDDPAKSLGDDFAGLMRRRILMLKNWDGFAMRFRGGMGLLLMGSNTSTGAAFGCFLL